jgi:hypothetical protein
MKIEHIALNILLRPVSDRAGSGAVRHRPQPKDSYEN